MDVPKQVQDKISKIQLLEQNMQNIILQKQNYQTQLLEVESALKELENIDSAYKIIGNIMVFSDKPKLLNGLNNNKELLDIRLSSLSKQETKLKEQTDQLQSEILKEIKK